MACVIGQPTVSPPRPPLPYSTEATMSDIDLIRQLKGDIQRTCDAYKADIKNPDARLAIDAIAEEAYRTAQTAIASLKHKQREAIQQQGGIQ